MCGTPTIRWGARRIMIGMTLDDLRALVNDNAVLLSVGGAVLGWSLKTWRERRIRLTSTLHSGTGFFARPDGPTLSVPDARLALFNGLLHEVAIHDVWMDLRAGGTVRRGLTAPVVDEVRRSIPAQHSTILVLHAGPLYAMRSTVTKDERRPVQVRLHIQLGNGARLRTGWATLRPPKESYSGGNVVPDDWDDTQAGSVPANGGDTGMPGAVT